MILIYWRNNLFFPFLQMQPEIPPFACIQIFMIFSFFLSLGVNFNLYFVLCVSLFNFIPLFLIHVLSIFSLSFFLYQYYFHATSTVIYFHSLYPFTFPRASDPARLLNSFFWTSFFLFWTSILRIKDLHHLHNLSDGALPIIKNLSKLGCFLV